MVRISDDLKLLFDCIDKELIQNNFVRHIYQITTDENKYGSSTYCFGNDCSFANFLDGGLTGYNLLVEKVNRHNGSAEDISYRIDIMHWEHSSGHSLYREKLSIHDSQKTIENKIKKVIKNYYKIVYNKD